MATKLTAFELCWDCATGNGQAAVALAEKFRRVIATDASHQQLEQATPHTRVEYRCERAEATSIADTSTDLITIAAALHWLDRPAFYREVRRVAKPGAVIAAWTYSVDVQISTAVDAVVAEFAQHVLRPFWAPELNHVLAGYRDLEFPFTELAFPAFSITTAWNLHHLLGNLNTWSGASRFAEANGYPATTVIAEQLTAAWRSGGPVDQLRPVRLPLYFRVGRIEK